MKRMYGLIKDKVGDVEIDIGHAVNSMFHAGAMINKKWKEEDPEMADWYDTSFRKVTCKVTEAQFEQAKKEAPDWFVVTEMAFDQKEVVLVFKPRDEYPKFFKFLPLYK